MSLLKIMVVAAVVVGLLMTIPIFFIYVASSADSNITVAGEYAGQWDFMMQINLLIAMVMSNLGYVVALLVIIGLLLAALAYAGMRVMYG